MSGHELSKFQLQEIQRINKEIQDYHKYLEKIHGKRVQTESVDISKLTKKMRARLEKQNSHITRFSQKKSMNLKGKKIWF